MYNLQFCCGKIDFRRVKSKAIYLCVCVCRITTHSEQFENNNVINSKCISYVWNFCRNKKKKKTTNKQNKRGSKNAMERMKKSSVHSCRVFFFFFYFFLLVDRYTRCYSAFYSTWLLPFVHRYLLCNFFFSIRLITIVVVDKVSWENVITIRIFFFYFLPCVDVCMCVICCKA